MDAAVGSAANESSLRRIFARGTTSFGVAAALERIPAFAGAVLAARVAGPSDFGAYALGLASAGVLAGYLGFGVQSVAVRFAARWSPGTKEFKHLMMLLSAYALAGATATAATLFFAAGPVASVLLQNGGLQRLVQVAAVYGFLLVTLGMIKGTLIGLLHLRTLAWLSGVSGLLLLIGLPLAASMSPSFMLLAQGVALGAGLIVAAVHLRRVSGVSSSELRGDEQGPTLRDLLRFGAVQTASGIGVNVASWLVILLVTRSSSGTQQTGEYAVGQQLNNVVSLGPSLIAQMVLPLMARAEGSVERENRIIEVATYLTSFIAFVVSGALFLLLPVVLHMYGHDYRNADLPATLLIGAGLVAMVSLPMAISLLVLRLRAFAWRNLAWAAVLVLFGLWLIPSSGASGAGAAWAAAMGVSGVLTLGTLARMGRLTSETFMVWTVAIGAAGALTVLGWFRGTQPDWDTAWMLGQSLVFLIFLTGLTRIGRSRGYLPDHLPRSWSQLSRFIEELTGSGGKGKGTRQ